MLGSWRIGNGRKVWENHGKSVEVDTARQSEIHLHWFLLAAWYTLPSMTKNERIELPVPTFHEDLPKFWRAKTPHYLVQGAF